MADDQRGGGSPKIGSFRPNVRDSVFRHSEASASKERCAVVDRILLIEDDAGAQILFRNRLTELGYEVVVASTGARGLLEARAGRFDLFLVDIGLGTGIDGYEVCRRLKGMPQTGGVPVVLISGQVKSQEELHRGYEAGCESFLVKGDLTLLEDVVRAMLRIKFLNDELGQQNRLLEDRNRHLKAERERGADLENALRDSGSRAHVLRELASGKPDGVLLVDAEGVVRMVDRGAQDILGKDIEGKHLASLAPGTGLEAFVRDARSEPREAYRFDLEWSNGAVRSLSASIMPTVPRSVGTDMSYRVVLLLDASKRRVAGEMLRIDEQGVPRSEMGPLLEAARSVYQPSAIIGEGREINGLRTRVAQAASAPGTVLIHGAPGTGKSFVARILHFASGATGPFIPVNCAAVASTPLESELFGHARGAFPEAISDRPGLFERAQDGMVFLDEIGELPSALQERLLEVLEAKRTRRMGSKRPEPVDVRVVAASGIDLDELVRQGRFRQDLLNRLREIEIGLPELGKGHEDIPVLTQYFLGQFGAVRKLEVSSEAQWVLGEYSWPRNVAELKNCIESACLQTAEPEIKVTDLPAPLFELYKRMSDSDAIPGPLPGSSRREHVRVKSDPLAEAYLQIDVIDEQPSLEAYEKKAILHALRETKGDKLAAAKLLKIGKSTFYRKLKTHGLS